MDEWEFETGGIVLTNEQENLHFKIWSRKMTYQEAREFIKQSNQYGCVPGLDTIKELMRRLGNPQEELKIIHVAGTNGKGSTAAFISSILAMAGYKVGRYISPAVFCYRESIQILKRSPDYFRKNSNQTKENSVIGIDCITEKGISETISRIKPICESMVAEMFAHPTSFEIETAMAMLYLLEEKVDFAVIEVGLGGKQDATNIMEHPICSVITPISMDHMNFLGDTLEKIASEKAGIIKKDSPVITSRQDSKVMKVLEMNCYNVGATLYLSGYKRIHNIEYTLEGTTFYLSTENKIQVYQIGVLGEYQVENALLAMKVIEVLNELGYPIDEDVMKQGLYETKWRGRFEVVRKKPYFTIDGAHNVEAARSLSNSIGLYFKNRRIIFIIGVLADKDFRSILNITASLADVIITVMPNNVRALSSKELAKEAKQYDKRVYDAGNMENAIDLAYREAGEEDVIMAFGSLSFLGEMVSTLEIRKDDDRYDR